MDKPDPQAAVDAAHDLADLLERTLGVARSDNDDRRTARNSAGRVMICTGCGSTDNIAWLRASRPGTLSCCPERKMVEASGVAVELVEHISRMTLTAEADTLELDNNMAMDGLIRRARAIVNVECPFSPTGKHIVDTSCDLGANVCFHCERPIS